MMESKVMNRGDVYWVNLDPVGSEIKKRRPCVLIGATPINAVRHTVVVVPLSTTAKAHPPLTIQMHSTEKPAVAICDQIRAVDKSRLINKMGQLSSKELESLEEGLRQVLVL